MKNKNPKLKELKRTIIYTLCLVCILCGTIQFLLNDNQIKGLLEIIFGYMIFGFQNIKESIDELI